MKLLSLIVLTTLSYVTLAQTKLIRSVPYVEVTGESELKVVPNEIEIAIRISERNKRYPLAEIERAMVDSLNSIGIDPQKQLSIEDLDGIVKYGVFRPVLKETRNYRLLLDNISHVSAVFEKLGGLRLDYMALIKVDHSDLDQYESQVKIEAIKSAKQKADLMLKELDQEVKGLLFVEEVGNDYSEYETHYPYSYGAVSRAIANPYDDYELNFKEISISYKILARFEIE